MARKKYTAGSAMHVLDESIDNMKHMKSQIEFIYSFNDTDPEDVKFREKMKADYIRMLKEREDEGLSNAGLELEL